MFFKKKEAILAVRPLVKEDIGHVIAVDSTIGQDSMHEQLLANILREQDPTLFKFVVTIDNNIIGYVLYYLLSDDKTSRSGYENTIIIIRLVAVSEYKDHASGILLDAIKKNHEGSTVNIEANMPPGQSELKDMMLAKGFYIINSDSEHDTLGCPLDDGAQIIERVLKGNCKVLQ